MEADGGVPRPASRRAATRLKGWHFRTPGIPTSNPQASWHLGIWDWELFLTGSQEIRQSARMRSAVDSVTRMTKDQCRDTGMAMVLLLLIFGITLKRDALVPGRSSFRWWS